MHALEEVAGDAEHIRTQAFHRGDDPIEGFPMRQTALPRPLARQPCRPEAGIEMHVRGVEKADFSCHLGSSLPPPAPTGARSRLYSPWNRRPRGGPDGGDVVPLPRMPPHLLAALRSLPRLLGAPGAGRAA